MTMQHTPGPWEIYDANPGVQLRFGPRPDPWGGVGTIYGGLCPTSFMRANAELAILAPTAPHDCDDATCAGNVTRLKLEAFEQFKAASEKMALFIGRWGNTLVGIQMSPQDFKEDCGLREYHAALAKTEKLG